MSWVASEEPRACLFYPCRDRLKESFRGTLWPRFAGNPQKPRRARTFFCGPTAASVQFCVTFHRRGSRKREPSQVLLTRRQVVIDRYRLSKPSTGGRKITWLLPRRLSPRYHRALRIERQDPFIALSARSTEQINFNRSTTHRSRANGVRLFRRRIVAYWHLSELPVYAYHTGRDLRVGNVAQSNCVLYIFLTFRRARVTQNYLSGIIGVDSSSGWITRMRTMRNHWRRNTPREWNACGNCTWKGSVKEQSNSSLTCNLNLSLPCFRT